MITPNNDEDNIDTLRTRLVTVLGLGGVGWGGRVSLIQNRNIMRRFFIFHNILNSIYSSPKISQNSRIFVPISSSHPPPPPAARAG